MPNLNDLLAEILDYSPTETSETDKKGEIRPFRPEIRPCENGLNSTPSPNSPLSPGRHLKSNSPDEESKERRRQKVLTMLEENPDKPRAFYVDPDSDLNSVIIAVAIRGAATCEIEIPQNKYDPFLFLEVINRAVQ